MLLSGEPMRLIGEKFGLTCDCLGRHKRKCLPALLARAAEAESTMSDVERLTAQLAGTIARSLEAVDSHGQPNHKARLKAAMAAIKLMKY